ncbi:MAG: ZIP family metal transporter [Candidatus Pacearchaeota archaeon]|nr:ZIP family metal transporter [Candidatus Pacearchaeota archaeon]
MSPVLLIILSVLIVSLISLIGILFIFLKRRTLDKLLIFLVSLSVGSLLGGAFLHLIPEIVNNTGFPLSIAFLILGGIILFFVIENFIHWRHCHIPTSKEHPHSLGTMNLIGDGLHNLIDGLIISASYFVSIPLGIATTLAVVIHEIPQEIGDFGVLLYAGFSKRKALSFNFLSALLALVGAVIGILFAEKSTVFVYIVMPIAVGGFLYIAGSDLIPEIHKQQEKRFSFRNLAGIILGILIMYALTFLKIG